MSYANTPIEPIGTRVPPVIGVPSPTRLSARTEGDPAAGTAAGSASRALLTPPEPARSAALSPAALRAQAVTGLLEARRSDVTSIDRALAEPGRAATASLATVWPEQDRTTKRPDARVAADLDLLEGAKASRASQAAKERALKAADQAALTRDLIAADVLDARASSEKAGRLSAAQTAASTASQAAAGTAAQTATRRPQPEAAPEQAPEETSAGPDRPSERGPDRATDRPREPRDRAPDAGPRPDRAPEARADEARREEEATPTRALSAQERAREVAEALSAVGRLSTTVQRLSATAAQAAERTLAEANDVARRVAELNGRIQAATRDGSSLAPATTWQRDHLVGALSRLTGATAQPGAGGAVDVLVDGRALVSGAGMRPLAVQGAPGALTVTTASGHDVTVTTGALAGHLDTANRLLPGLAGTVTAVLDRVAAQAGGPAGAVVDGGPRAAALLGGQLAELSRAAESSTAYSQIATGVQDLLHRLATGDVPAAVRASDLVLGAITGPEPTVPMPSLESTVSPLRTSLSALGRAAAEIAAPGGAGASRVVVSDAPTLVSVFAAPDAPAGVASVRVLSAAASGTAVTAQSFAPDAALGDGTERSIGLVRGLGTPQEAATVIEVGRYPTISDVATSINQANLDVRATVAPVGVGTVQLHITSLTSGRSSSVTILNGENPPTTSSILGRVVPLVSGRDTLLEVQRPGQSAGLVHTSERLVTDILPGVDLQVRAADAGRVFHVGVQRLSSETVERAGRLVAAAAGAVSAAQAAGAPATAAMVWGALGLQAPPGSGVPGAGVPGSGVPGLGVPGTGPAGTAGVTPDETLGADGFGADGLPAKGRPGLPGVHRDTAGLPAFHAAQLTAAFERDAKGTQAQLSATARALAGVAADADGATWEAYAAARAAHGPNHFATYAPPSAHQAQDQDRVSEQLTRREEALRAVLVRLQDQQEWLGGQLATN